VPPVLSLRPPCLREVARLQATSGYARTSLDRWRVETGQGREKAGHIREKAVRMNQKWVTKGLINKEKMSYPQPVKVFGALALS